MPLPKAPPIGKLRNLAVIELWRDEPMAGEQSYPTYQPVGQAWCSIEPKIGEQIWSGGVAVLENVDGGRATHVLTMRYREDLTHEHHLVVNRMRYRIVRVQRDDARRYVRCDCELYGDSSMVGVPPIIPKALDDGG